MIQRARELFGLAPPILLALLLPFAAPATPGLLGEAMKSEDAEAGTLLLETADGLRPAPTLETDVEIDVTGMIARVRVAQRFHNPSDDWVEGVYVFPLPGKSAVDGLGMVVGERIIEGRIETREEAKRVYRKARQEGRKASLLEQERPNIFTTSVANIGPGEDVEVRIEYQEDLRYDQGRFSLRFPMVVGPRYIPGTTRVAGFEGTGWAANTSQVPDAARVTPAVAHPSKGPINPVRIVARIDAGFALPVLRSPSHAIEVERSGSGVYHVRLREDAVPADSDFVLEWEPAVGAAPEAALFTEELDGEQYALLMVMPPNAKQPPERRLPRETIFVIDTSGSMHGASIAQAREALVLAIHRLRPGDRFNVIRFDSRAEKLFPDAVPVDAETKGRAVAWVQGLEADGGTEMLAALRMALEDSESRAGIRQVIFVTDGSVGNEAALFRFIETSLGASRLFTVGIGSAPNSWFMTRAAEFGRGTFTFIGSPAEVKSRMGELFAKLESPVLSDIRMAWDARHVEAWPRRIPDLYLGEPVVVAARMAKLGGEVVIDGRRGDEPWKLAFAVNGGARESGIGRLWARRKVAALMGSLHEDGDPAEVKRAVADLGLRFHLVTRYTSLVAVDVTPTAPVGVTPDTRPLPTNLPKGWSYEHVSGGKGPRPQLIAMHSVPTRQGVLPQTATPAPLLLLLGAAIAGGAGVALAFLRRRATA